MAEQDLQDNKEKIMINAIYDGHSTITCVASRSRNRATLEP